MTQLTGKCALVTGAASGIGLSTARALLRAGASVVAIDAAEHQPLADDAGDPASALLALRCDVRDRSAVESAVRAAVDRYGGLHVLCNCAAVAPAAPFLEITEDTWQQTIGVNLYGTFTVCQAAIPAMRRSGGGSIINVGSIASVVAEESLAAYCAAKGGVLMLTKVIALEHARDNIRANCLCPGMVDTPMAHPYYEPYGGKEEYAEEVRQWQPLGLGNPDQIAAVVLFLASEAASFVTGTALMADGGFTAM